MTETETIQTRVVFQDMLNDQGILFGGIALSWMDEVAYISATRHTGERVVTVSVENVNFVHPVKQGSIVEIKGVVTTTGRVKLTVHVVLVAQGMHAENKILAAEGNFIFAAVDENQNPVKLPTACLKSLSQETMPV